MGIGPWTLVIYLIRLCNWMIKKRVMFGYKRVLGVTHLGICLREKEFQNV